MSEHYRCDRCRQAITTDEPWGRIYMSQTGPPYDLCCVCIREFHHEFMGERGRHEPIEMLREDPV